MAQIKIQYLSNSRHISQILTGFHRLSDKYSVSITGQSAPGPALVRATYQGMQLIYDTHDGYFDVAYMTKLLQECDLYFQRSCDPEKNRLLFGELSQKIHPLGFNYHVTYRGNPAEKSRSFLQAFKQLRRFCPPEYFEGTPNSKESASRILFYTRLWPRDPSLPEHVNQEREQINETRIRLLRLLKARFGKRFDGGVEDCPLARSLCPELLLPWRKTNPRAYIRQLHRSHICIGSVGLHGSIGWKTGEYVAAAKAIVLEHFSCTLPGSFSEGENYLSFQSPEECLAAVERLIQDPKLCRKMQENNYRYYQNYLNPEALIQNTLCIADQAASRR